MLVSINMELSLQRLRWTATVSSRPLPKLLWCSEDSCQ